MDDDTWLIDVSDVFRLLYGTHASAKVAQSKHFSASGLVKTAAILKCPVDQILVKVKWNNSPRMHVAATAPHVVKMLRSGKIHSSNAARLADIISAGPPLRPVDCKNVSTTSKRNRPSGECDEIVTIYKVVHITEEKAVYTGKTKSPSCRLKQHQSKSSACRLMRHALQKNGIQHYRLVPIMRCRAADADANESYWIIQNNTLFPNGYNLRHGSKAGDNSDEEYAISPTCTGIIPFQGVTDEAMAVSEAWSDLAEMCGDTQMKDNAGVRSKDAKALCTEFLVDVHPDKQAIDTATYSATDVSAMLNAIRSAL